MKVLSLNGENGFAMEQDDLNWIDILKQFPDSGLIDADVRVNVKKCGNFKMWTLENIKEALAMPCH